METPRYLECLRADAARLREVAATALDAQVPTCPEWSMTDLVKHVGTVYLHKVAAIRHNAWPDPWPPPEVADEPPLDLLDRSLPALLAELTAHEPGDKALTWYDPDQTVGFWTRRMAQETVIHRVDAELAAKAPIASIPDDLAVDGIDELLIAFFAFTADQWPEDFGDSFPAAAGRTLTLSTGQNHWHVRLAATGAPITRDASPADTTISGTPQDLLLWLWRRAPGTPLHLEGDHPLATTFHDWLREATQ